MISKNKKGEIAMKMGGVGQHVVKQALEKGFCAYTIKVGSAR